MGVRYRLMRVRVGMRSHHQLRMLMRMMGIIVSMAKRMGLRLMPMRVLVAGVHQGDPSGHQQSRKELHRLDPLAEYRPGEQRA